MARRDYTSISLSKKLMEYVEEFIKEHPELGYTSSAEFVKETIRWHIRRLKEELKSE